jgi:hypothetical protein
MCTIKLESPRELEGGPVWREAAFAFDNGCRLTGESNENLGLLLPMLVGREGRVSGEAVRQWRQGPREAPFWAYRGLWRRLISQGFTPGTLYDLMGFSFRD